MIFEAFSGSRFLILVSTIFVASEESMSRREGKRKMVIVAVGNVRVRGSRRDCIPPRNT